MVARDIATDFFQSAFKNNYMIKFIRVWQLFCVGTRRIYVAQMCVTSLTEHTHKLGRLDVRAARPASATEFCVPVIVGVTIAGYHWATASRHEWNVKGVLLIFFKCVHVSKKILMYLLVIISSLIKFAFVWHFYPKLTKNINYNHNQWA